MTRKEWQKKQCTWEHTIGIDGITYPVFVSTIWTTSYLMTGTGYWELTIEKATY